MDNYISELIEIGMGNVIDKCVDGIILEDEVYKKDMKDAEEIHDRLYESMTPEQRGVFEDYIACMMSANERACNLSYLIGAKNTIRFMKL